MTAEGDEPGLNRASNALLRRWRHARDRGLKQTFTLDIADLAAIEADGREQRRALTEELFRRHDNAAAEALDMASSPPRRSRARVRRDVFAEALALVTAIEQGRPYRG